MNNDQYIERNARKRNEGAIHSSPVSHSSASPEHIALARGRLDGILNDRPDHLRARDLPVSRRLCIQSNRRLHSSHSSNSTKCRITPYHNLRRTLPPRLPDLRRCGPGKS